MNILMVCLGNICRSPVAEGILRNKAEEKGLALSVDSCGTSGYHNGEAPDQRSAENAALNGIDISGLISRKFRVSDFEDFDRIYVMDHSNYQNIMKLAVTDDHRNKVDLLLNAAYPGQNRDVPDPYFGGKDGFQQVFDLVEEACENIINELA